MSTPQTRPPLVAGIAPGVGTSTLAAALHARDGGVLDRRADIVVCRPTAAALRAAAAVTGHGPRPVLVVTGGPMAAPLPAALRARFGAVVEVPHVPRWAGREAPLAEAAEVLVEPAQDRPEALHRYAAALRIVVAALLGSGQLDADPPGVVRGRTVEPWRDRRADPSPRTGRRATVPPTPGTSAAAEPTTTPAHRELPRGVRRRGSTPAAAPPPAGRGDRPPRIPTPREPDADTRPTCRQREGRQTRSADSIPTRRTRPRRAPSTDADPEPHHLSPRTTFDEDVRAGAEDPTEPAASGRHALAPAPAPAPAAPPNAAGLRPPAPPPDRASDGRAATRQPDGPTGAAVGAPVAAGRTGSRPDDREPGEVADLVLRDRVADLGDLGGDLVAQGAAAGFEALAQPHEWQLRRQSLQLLTQAGHRRSNDAQAVGCMRRSSRVVSGDAQCRRQRDAVQVARVDALLLHRLCLAGVTCPQEHLVPPGRRHGQGRTPGAGTQHCDLHRGLGPAEAAGVS